MSALVPRATLHRGVVSAQGLWFSPGLVSPDTVRARVLAAWEPGARVFALGEGYVMQLARARAVTVSTSSAAPLTRHGSTLLSAPLRPSERAALPDDAWLIVIEAGAPRAFRAGELPEVSLADWLDLSAFERWHAAPPAALAAPPNRLAIARDPRAVVEQRVERTAELRAHQTALLTALTTPTNDASRPRVSGALPAAMRGFVLALGTLFGAYRARVGTKTASAGGAPGTELATARSERHWLDRLSSAFARLVARTRVMRFLARKQAEYLRSLLDALDAQDDLEVLRRAIPLGGESSLDPPTPALSAPSLRTDFRISLGGLRAAPSIGLGEDLFAQLRRSYELVLERLIRAGKHEEAAFFLAEILRDPARAVDLLERQGKLRLAAELAEARKLAPGLVVRQWFLAGDTQRAISIAVREGAFVDAIGRLERSGKTKEADALRFSQADRLASAGRWLAASRVVVGRPGGTPFALRWLELLREAGDVTGLALELSLDAERFERVQAALEPLLAESGPHAVRRRVQVAEELIRLDVVIGKPLGRELGRELLVDAGALGDRAARQAVRGLADWLGGAFRADSSVEMPEADTVRPLALREYTFAESDAGTRPIHDACECGPRLVVALGEAGVLVLDRGGKQVAAFDVPAERLVVSEDGTRLLTLARRGPAWRVSQIDLATRRSRAWGELEASTFARTFDGETWVVAQGIELLVLDVFDDTPSVLRRVPLPDGLQTRRIRVDSGTCNVVGVEVGAQLVRLRYELPGWTLREVKLIELGPRPPEGAFVGDVEVTSTGPATVLGRWAVPGEGGFSPLGLRHGDTEIALPPRELPAPRQTALLRTSAAAFAASSNDQDGASRVLVGSLGASQVQASLVLEGSGAICLRVGSENAVIGDDLGRLLLVDLSSGRLIRDLRL